MSTAPTSPGTRIERDLLGARSLPSDAHPSSPTSAVADLDPHPTS